MERCWGIPERHWNGALLDSLAAVVGYSASMTWKGRHPAVAVVTTVHQTGVTLTTQAMASVEAHLTRLPGLANWFVELMYQPPAAVDASFIALPLAWRHPGPKIFSHISLREM